MGCWITMPLLLLLATYCCTVATSSKSGILKLIVKTYVDELLSISDRLDDDLMKRKLLKLSDHVSTHPALHQKHLYVGLEPPNYDPDMTRSGRLRSLDSISKRQESSSGTGDDKTTEAAAEVMTTTSTTASPVTVPIADVLPTTSAISIVSPSNLSVPSKAGKTGDDKVSKSQFPSEEICVTDRSWEQINETNDFYDNKVEIVQEEGLQQFVFTYRCANMKAACTGVSPFYHSECTERFGWIYMYYRKSPSDQPQWGYVAAPHHCACKITPNVNAAAAATSRK